MYDERQVDEAVLALLHLNAFKDRYGWRAWNGLDRGALDRLHERGLMRPQVEGEVGPADRRGRRAGRGVVPTPLRDRHRELSSWDRDGRWLFISLGDPGGPLDVWSLDTHDAAATWQALTLEDDDRAIVAVAGESDTRDAAALLVRASDGQLTIAGAVLAEGPTTLPFPRISGLAPVEGTETFDAGDFFPLVEPVGLATVQQEGEAASWDRGQTIGWLVGDGRRLWLAGGPGDAVFIRDDAAMISVTPALNSPGS